MMRSGSAARNGLIYLTAINGATAVAMFFGVMLYLIADWAIAAVLDTFRTAAEAALGVWLDRLLLAVKIAVALAATWLAARLFRGCMSGTLPAEAAREMRKAPISASFGLMVIWIYILCALFAPLIAPFPEREVVGAQYLPWSETHPLGTDNVGRDMLSRLIFGARNTLGIAVATTLLAFLIGTVFGLLAAVLRGWVDQILSRIVDVLMAIPSLVFALLLLTMFGTSVLSLILVIAVLDSTRVFRLARAVAYGIVVMDYVEAARIRGEGLWYVMRREILPNAAPPLVAEFGLRFCFVFLTISALSFLGLGIQPPLADWGSMVKENDMLISFRDPTPLLPAGAIALLTVAVNFVVDWMLHKASGLKE